MSKVTGRGGKIDVRRDEELVLDVYEMLRHLNGFQVRVLDRMLNAIGSSHRPGAGRATDLKLARAREAHVGQLARLELGRW